MHDRISNYRQVRLILQPSDGDWRRAYWSLHFVTVRQGVPRTDVVEDGLILIPSETPTRQDFYRTLEALLHSLA